MWRVCEAEQNDAAGAGEMNSEEARVMEGKRVMKGFEQNGAADKAGLESFAQGEVEKQFERAFGAILKNMLDPNTSPTEKRKITIEMTFEQDEDRSGASVQVRTKIKKADAIPAKTMLSIRRDLGTGEIVAEEYGRQIRGQQSFDPDTGEIFEKARAMNRFKVLSGEGTDGDEAQSEARQTESQE